ncbi:MAG: STAS domain-containing protein [Planctomycetota bacterium]
MDKTLAETADHSILIAEARGDTLIVTPRGDRAGFSEVDFSVELKRVQAVLQGGQFDNVIIDLSQANYFGSEMIGVINGLLDQARRNGGKGGVCDVSTDMMEGLKIMNLADYWPIYNSRSHAASDIVNESVVQSASRLALRKYGGVLVAAAALLLVAWAGSTVYGVLFPGPDQAYLSKLESFHDTTVTSFRYNERGAWQNEARDLNQQIREVQMEIQQSGMADRRKAALVGYAVKIRTILQVRTPGRDLFDAASNSRTLARAVFAGRVVPEFDDLPDPAEDATADEAAETDEPGEDGPAASESDDTAKAGAD